MRAIIVPLTAALLALSPVIPATAQVLGDADVIDALMTAQGYDVKITIDDYGDPQITSHIDDIRFDIYFYDCERRTCDSIQFTAGFDMPNPQDIGRMNSWNRDSRLAKVYLDDEGDPFLETNLVLSGEGIGRRNFDAVLSGWQDSVTQFTDFIDW